MTLESCRSIGSRDSDLIWKDIATIAFVSQEGLFTYLLNQPVMVVSKETGEVYMMPNAAVASYSQFAKNHGIKYTYFYKN